MSASGPHDRERGGVLVMVALWLPLLLIFASFVIDVANWFEHQRHLQTQADAGALAAGGSFTFPTCSNSAITSMATQYANVENPQVGGTQPAVTALINSTNYFNQGGTSFSDGQPCADGYVDVKMTESNLPFFFGILGLFGGPTTVPAINAHARVSILNETSQGGAMPIGVPDNNPTSAAVIVVNDDTGATVSAWQLTASATPVTLSNGTVLTEWDNGGAPATLTIPSGGANLAVVVALRGGTTPIDLTSNSWSTICNETLVICYQATVNTSGTVTATQGLTFIHGYPTTGTGTATVPIIRDAYLSGGSCVPDPYFSDVACSPTLYVKADFGGAQPAGAVATGAGCPNKGCPLQFNAVTGYWYGPIAAPPGSGNTPPSGAYPLAFAWCTSSASCTANTATGSAAKVQRMYVASSDPAVSGPVDLVQVSEQSGATLSNSLAAGTYSPGTANGIVFSIGVVESLNAIANSATDSPVLMRLAGNGQNASLNYSLDCDPALPNLSDELWHGCGPQYAVNQGVAPWNPCPSPSVFGMQQPWQCVNTQTGQAVGQVWQGLDNRFNDQPGSCANPSEWGPTSPGGLSPGDPRIVQVFLVPFGSFSGAGTTSVPVEGFATFYVTGWSNDPCKTGSAWWTSGGTPTAGLDDPVPSGNGAYMIGHFIKYVNQLNNGGGSGACNPNSLNTCIAVLTQ